jgi:hypothetical protein
LPSGSRADAAIENDCGRRGGEGSFSSNEMAEVSISFDPSDRYSYTMRLLRQKANST